MEEADTPCFVSRQCGSAGQDRVGPLLGALDDFLKVVSRWVFGSLSALPDEILKVGAGP
jgi:hypothetical protein